MEKSSSQEVIKYTVNNSIEHCTLYIILKIFGEKFAEISVSLHIGFYSRVDSFWSTNFLLVARESVLEKNSRGSNKFSWYGTKRA